MDERELVVRADEILPFSLAGEEETYASQCLISKDAVGSTDLMMSRATLRTGKALHGGVHPETDEAYYVLRGKARLTLGGSAKDGAGGDEYEIGPDTAVFIPAGTFHRLDNRNGNEDFVFLGIWPKEPRPGENTYYDERQKLWGTSFRKLSSAQR